MVCIRPSSASLDKGWPRGAFAGPEILCSNDRVDSIDPISLNQQPALTQQLRRILESEFFRNSQRCSRFLEYSVHHLIHQQPDDELKERRIGIDVFHRAPDYDTARDNIVRVTANEVRKRLAQFYGSVGMEDPLILDMPPGTYIVTVRVAKPGAGEVSDEVAGDITFPPVGKASSSRKLPGNRIAIFILVVIVLCLIAGTVFYRHLRVDEVVRQVWSPLLQGPSPTIVSIAEPVAYEPASGSTVATGSTEPMVPLKNAFVGVGDAYALADIARYLTEVGTSWRMVAGNQVPSQDLRSSPMVLIGAHSNLWTTKLMADLRFSFGENNTVLDRTRSTPSWSLPSLRPDWQTTEDYAIVSRFRSPQTGQPVIIIGGLTNLGTQAAGEFLVSSDLLNAALEKAPKGWQSRNFQFVLHTRIIGNTPERPTVVASYFW